MSTSSSSPKPKTERSNPYKNLAFSIKPILFKALCNVMLISLSISAIGICKSSQASMAPTISDPGFTSTSSPILDWKYPRSVVVKNKPTLLSFIICVTEIESSSSIPAISFLRRVYLPLSSSIATTSGCCS